MPHPTFGPSSPQALGPVLWSSLVNPGDDTVAVAVNITRIAPELFAHIKLRVVSATGSGRGTLLGHVVSPLTHMMPPLRRNHTMLVENLVKPDEPAAQFRQMLVALVVRSTPLPPVTVQNSCQEVTGARAPPHPWIVFLFKGRGAYPVVVIFATPPDGSLSLSTALPLPL